MRLLLLLFACQEPDFDPQREMVKIRRVYVDKFTTGEGSEQIRDHLLAALERSKLFIVTENAERADAFLRGGGEDHIFVEDFQYRDGIGARASAGTGRASRTGGGYVSTGLNEDDSQRQTERKREATAAVRLVTRDGDLIWSTAQESRGSKVRNAAADLAARIVDQLRADCAKARESAARK
jgi:hypothetical protein